MGMWALILATILYGVTAFDLAVFRKNYPMSIVFVSYAIANLCYVYMAYYKDS
jgi:hypothetical protein